MTDTFCKIPHTIMAATHWVSLATGQHLTLSGCHKILWVWMKDRYDFFTSSGKDWFDNQDDIAEHTGCSVSTVKRFIQDLTKHGYLIKAQRKLHGCAVSNSYTIVQALVLATPKKVAPIEKAALQTSPVLEERTPDYEPIIFPPNVTHTKTLVKLPSPTIEHVFSFCDEPQWEIRSSS